MDLTIHSQIQSPLVRTLQSIPTNSANFLHGIPDNTPPFSKTQIRVKKHVGNENDLYGIQRFKIPQQGHLNNAYLLYRMYGHRDNSGNCRYIDSDNVFNFSEGIEYIELKSYNNVIQRIYAECIPFEVASLAQGEQMLKNSLQGLAGYKGALGSAILFPPRFSTPTIDASLGDVTSQGDIAIRDFLIPIPLSSTFYLKDNFQTRLLEDLEIVIKTRPATTQFKGTNTVDTNPLPIVDRHEFELVLDYINFHENVEEVIRNENFKPDVPAALLQSDYIKFRALHSSSESSGTSGTTVIHEVKLNTDALVTDIFIVPKVLPTSRLYERPQGMRLTGFYYELKSSNEVIMSGYKGEYDGIEARHFSTVNRQYQNEGVLPLRWASDGTRIRLGLNNTDEYFDGGISFQSLVEPTLTIRATVVTAAPYVFRIDVGGGETGDLVNNPTNVEYDVILKRKVMLRIDGNTGKIAKSLES